MKMTREEAKEMLPIIQAWADGKTVEWYDIGIGWRASRFELDFDKNPKYFRIKSESESKYRPFKSQEECFDEMMKHQPFGWFRSTCNKNLSNIVGIDDNGMKITNTLYKSKVTYDSAFTFLKFVDGTPFGIKEE